jgi:hypothetical protein
MSSTVPPLAARMSATFSSAGTTVAFPNVPASRTSRSRANPGRVADPFGLVRDPLRRRCGHQPAQERADDIGGDQLGYSRAEDLEQAVAAGAEVLRV